MLEFLVVINMLIFGPIPLNASKSSTLQMSSKTIRQFLSDNNFDNAYYHRSKAYFLKKDYDKSWIDIHRAQEIGCSIIDSDFLADLKKASRRQQ